MVQICLTFLPGLQQYSIKRDTPLMGVFAVAFLLLGPWVQLGSSTRPCHSPSSRLTWHMPGTGHCSKCLCTVGTLGPVAMVVCSAPDSLLGPHKLIMLSYLQRLYTQVILPEVSEICNTGGLWVWNMNYIKVFIFFCSEKKKTLNTSPQRLPCFELCFSKQLTPCFWDPNNKIIMYCTL